MQMEKKDVKLSLFIHDLIEYIGKELAKNCNDYMVFEIVNNTAYITIHKMKYLGKNLTM